MATFCDTTACRFMQHVAVCVSTGYCKHVSVMVGCVNIACCKLVSSIATAVFAAASTFSPETVAYVTWRIRVPITLP